MSQPARKKQKTNNSFFNVADFEAGEAEEGPSDDEDWEDNIDEDVDEAELEKHRKDVEKRYYHRQERTLNPDIGRSHYDEQQDIIQRLQQKYVDVDNQSVAASEWNTSVGANVASTAYPHSVSQVPQASQVAPARHHVYHAGQSAVSDIVPGVLDPNLWLVPCLPGKERFAVEELLKKYFKYISHPKKLFIHTAFTTDTNTGYIYVEAFKEIHVRRACEDIPGLNTWKLRLVPRAEMTDALTIKSSGPQVKRGQWCRFMRGLYKGDLAQVYAIMDQGSRVILKVVPRIDYAKLSIMNSQQHEQQQQQRGSANFVRRARPPQKQFNKTEIAMYDDGSKAPINVHNEDLGTRIWRWRGKMYKNGCQLVPMPVNQVEFDVTAAPEEVQLLRSKTGDDEEDEDDDMDKVAAPIFQKSCQFVRGDTVKVIRGAMTNLIGEVLTTQPNPTDGKITVTVLPEHKDLNEAILFPSDELTKFFKVGCHVKVKRGKYKDETGLIIKVEQDENTSGANINNGDTAADADKAGEVIIFSDLTSRTIRVHINDITETSEVSTGRDVLGNYALYELVYLSRDVVGVIVSIQNGTFKILDNKDQIQTCRLPDIARHSRDDHAIALDIDNHPCRIGDVVIPQVGDFKSQRATVKHVYRSVLFLHTKSCTVNSGIFVCRSRLCRLAGGRLRMNSSVTQQGRSDTKNDRRLRILHNHRSSKDPWMHKTVKVKCGSFKGMIGIVCGCTDQKLHIELHAKCKKIQIKREDVKVINQDGSDIDDSAFNGNMRGPQHGGGGGNSRMNGRGSFGGGGGGGNWRGPNSQHNGHGRGNNMRSQYGARDMYRQAQTPLIGVQTPAYGDHMGAATPGMMGSQTPAMGSQTPGYGGVTPAYGASTPGGGDAWNVGGMTPAHNPQTPASPSYAAATPNSYHASPRAHSIGHASPRAQIQHRAPSDTENSHNSESEQTDLDRIMQQDPFYFIVENALLTYRGQQVVIKSVDKTNGVCSVALRGSMNEIYQSNVPMHLIEHTVPSDASNARVKVVFGKLAGDVGTLIGIDNDEAVVQLSATTDVAIIGKRMVVIYVDEE
eukprot:CAMPEP_0202691370 /NCGR_PEP_ID=MMETSP1385-20130828/6104_1 /ASSEMBLY_ACC=CAM_ASM_000861 /TAXON_ID=933848 /ORGANISM="Elphidium margaritaceum" /LENGTH=1067 /DNA_ID=CAMNT_0049346769 /DNA_START=65 /DNA_END=3268 /DNA_ORIENTATION=-